MNVADATGTVTGRIYDAKTRLPMEGATITLIVNGEKRTTTSQSTADEALKGYFTIKNIPSGGHNLTVEAEGFATLKALANVDKSNDNTPVTTYLGPLYMGKKFDLTMVVTYNGEPVEGAPIYSTSYYENYLRVYNSTLTDSNGIATFIGLDISRTHSIWVPPFDADGDGIYDYKSTESFDYYEPDKMDRTISIALIEVNHNNIEIIATSSDQNHDASFNIQNATDLGFMDFGYLGYGDPNYYSSTAENYEKHGVNSTGKNGPIVFVFNNPISFSNGDLMVTWRDYLINPDADNNGVEDTGYAIEKIIQGATFSIDSTGTILKVTPPAANGWPNVNCIINIVGTVTAINGSQIKFLNEPVYIENDTPSGLNQSTVITADNYRNDINNYSNEVYLEFPEYVYGTYKLEAKKESGSAFWTIYDYDNVFLYTGDLIYTDGTNGVGSGVFFRAKLNYFYYIRENDMIRVKFDLMDAAGNRFFGTKELTIQ